MSSDIEFGQMERASGRCGRRAQLKEFERQLRYLDKWEASAKREAAKKRKQLRVRIQKLKFV